MTSDIRSGKEKGKMTLVYFHAMHVMSEALIHEFAVYASNAATSHNQRYANRIVQGGQKAP